MTLSEGELRESSVPDLRLNVLADVVFPFIRDVFDPSLPIGAFPNEVGCGKLDITKRALTSEAMKSALMKGSQGTG